MADESSILHGSIVRARAGAALGLAIGLGVAALAGVYIAFVAGVLDDAKGYPMTGFIYIAAVGVIPLVVGLPIALLNAIRLRLLVRAASHPEQVTDAELAMRWGKPALRLHFADHRNVVIATGDLDRNQLIELVRAGTMPRKLPGARVVT